MFFIASIFGCISQEEKEYAKKYGLKYVYLDSPLELKKEPYKKILNFKAKYSANSSKFFLELYYLNLDYRFFSNNKKIIDSIHQSLINFSIKIYDAKKKQQLSFLKITQENNLSFSTATPSIFLTEASDINIKIGKEYQIILEIPAKKNTPEEYLKPTFVAGIALDPFWE